MRASGTVVLFGVSVLMIGGACGGGGGSDKPKPPQPQTATVARAGTGTGTVTSTPAGIACGDTCSASFTGGASVTLLAETGADSKFVGWSGACAGLQNPCVVKMDAAAKVTASFWHGGSGLPAPGAGGVAKPSGTAGNLQVLDWAGFAAAVSYSFDDAFPSQVAADNYAVIHATGVPVTYYVVPSQVAQHLDAWKQALADGNELGNHTANHCKVDGTGKLSTCLYGGTPAAGSTALSQITDANTYLEETVGAPGVWTLASPYGDANWNAPTEAAHMLLNREVDYSGQKLGVPAGDLTKQFHVPSVLFGNQYGGLGDTAEVIEGRIDTVRSNKLWSIFLFHSLAPMDPTDASTCCVVPAANVATSLDYLKSLGDVWGGTVVDVGAYWVGQYLVAHAAQTTSGDKTTWTWTLPDNFPPGKCVRVKVDGGTLSQGTDELVWDEHGFYEVALDAGELTLTAAP
jgi:peptidoglycan/xylan/chitin deacetylase (PgdA/CDA1 family)